MRTRFSHPWVVLALALCVSPATRQPASATTAKKQGIEPALLAKASGGDAAAQYQLGNAYNYGVKVRRDYGQAAFWYRKGAEQSDPDSQFMLGGLYHFGRGVPQDDAQAFAWIMKAAQQGHTNAEFFISTCYSEGWGVAENNAQALVWLRKAAEQGHAKSQYMLGWAYKDGIGGPQNYEQAYFWLDLASSEASTRKNQHEARIRRDEAAVHLTPAELSSEQQRVQVWLEQHPAKSE